MTITVDRLREHCCEKFPAPVFVTVGSASWIVATSGQHLVAVTDSTRVRFEAPKDMLEQAPPDLARGLVACLTEERGEREIDLASLRNFVGEPDVVSPCSDCGGLGTQLCDQCSGEGKILCGFCEGDLAKVCSYCRVMGTQTGRAPCEPCAGAGTLICPECEDKDPLVPLRPGWILGHAFDLNLIARAIKIATDATRAWARWSALSQALALHLDGGTRILVMPCEAKSGVWGEDAPAWNEEDMPDGLIIASRALYLTKRNLGWITGPGAMEVRK